MVHIRSPNLGMFRRSGLESLIGLDHIFLSLAEAFDYCEVTLNYSDSQADLLMQRSDVFSPVSRKTFDFSAASVSIANSESDGSRPSSTEPIVCKRVAETAALRDKSSLF